MKTCHTRGSWRVHRSRGTIIKAIAVFSIHTIVSLITLFGYMILQNSITYSFSLNRLEDSCETWFHPSRCFTRVIRPPPLDFGVIPSSCELVDKIWLARSTKPYGSNKHTGSSRVVSVSHTPIFILTGLTTGFQ